MSSDSEIIERYLERLRSALGEVAPGEREEILSDIRCLLQERLEAEGDGASAEAALARLGAPEALADSYRMEGLLTRAAHSAAPLLVARAALRWAFHGVRGFLTGLVVLVGYAMALGFLATAVLKPVLPEKTGLWTGPGFFTFGIMESHPGGREWLGYWIIPVGALLALGTFVLTTRLARWCLRSHAHALSLKKR